MITSKRTAAVLSLSLCLSLIFSGCGVKDGGVPAPSDGVISVADVSPAEPVDANSVFSERDLSGEYDGDDAVTLALTETVTVTEGGVYILSGRIDDGQIIVEADKSDKVQLVLDGVDVTANGKAALYVKSADKVFVTLADGTENRLSSFGELEADGDVNVDGAVFSRDDLTVNGKGSLTVTSETCHGIVSKDDLKITGGTISVEAASHALSGKDSVSVAGGVLTLTSGKDGIHSENGDDASLGNVTVTGGEINVTSDGDGISGGASVEIDGGKITVTAGGGSANGETHTDNMWGRFPGGVSDGGDDSVSTKGIKSDGALIITGGTIGIDSADDGLHANGNVTVSGADTNVNSGGDGIHADGSVAVTSGNVTVGTSYEGIEGKTITISGGNVDVTASDDGFNASDGSGDMGGFGGGRPGSGMQGGAPDGIPGGDGGDPGVPGDAEVYLLISGGVVHVDAGGDGLDSNGSLYVTGGEVYVDGPTNSGNGALDYGTDAVITGGTVVAVGASGMAENFGASSTQGSIMYNANGLSGKITLRDSAGNVLAEFEPSKSFSSVVVSAPGVTEGETYTLDIGGNILEIKMTSMIYGEGSGFGNPGGGPGGGFGGRPGRR